MGPKAPSHPQNHFSGKDSISQAAELHDYVDQLIEEEGELSDEGLKRKYENLNVWLMNEGSVKERAGSESV